MRFVVFRKYRGLDMWYVEAPTQESALDRVFPEDPEADGRFTEDGGAEWPHLEAKVAELELRAHPLRRFPPNVEVAIGSRGHRRIGPEGEPRMRFPRRKTNELEGRLND